ncbi:sigma-54-dependent Fis family transcriptional regulator [Allostella sp. ATCC 35155]|nr:sigma-54-dependent Fis family transcriptional regulator [Stella sp. ATCC 35155]
MPQRRPLVLLVEDTPSLADLYADYLRREPIELKTVQRGTDALMVLRRDAPAAILLDLNLPDMAGMDILKEINQGNLNCSVIVITAHGSLKTAVEAMQHGARDFIVKPFTADRLTVTLRNALERQRLVDIVETYEETFGRDRFARMIGASLPMQTVYRTIESAAGSRATVFITGESGTGKELCAEAVHQMSPRKARPFVALNCAAIPRDLLESEIFGHVKGAFTGATADRDGAASQANAGTLFLDELAEMDLGLQAKLLRFVQTNSFQKVGSGRTETVDIRFICATNRDPLKEVAAGRFREDLYYRLHVVPVHMPPLRERDLDVLLLAREFVATYAKEEGKRFRGLASDVERTLILYDWPGNVRQLQNMLRGIVVLHDGEEITLDMLPAAVRDGPRRAPEPHAAPPGSSATPTTTPAAMPHAEIPTGPGERIRPLWQTEKEEIERAITICAGNITEAAALLQINPSTIYRKKQKWHEDGLD